MAENNPIQPGQRFGKYVAVQQLPHNGKRQRWECRCDCGAVRVVQAQNLKRGTSKSCGCRKAELTAAKNFRHGLSHTPIWNTYSGVLGRCENPKHKDYARYGGRGIRVCARWRGSVGDFAEDMGAKPTPKHTLDRIDPDGHYSCGKCGDCKVNGWVSNVRWASPQVQARNKRNTPMATIGAVTLCIRDWAESVGLRPTTLLARVKRGMPEGLLLLPARNAAARRWLLQASPRG